MAIGKLIGMREAATILGVSRATVYEMARAGDFTVYDVRGLKTTHDDLLRFIESRRIPGAFTLDRPRMAILPNAALPVIVDDSDEEEGQRLADEVGG